MASYTIEDIELIRRKSGISYQEAVALLDYHNGNVARALVDLERNGRIKPEKAQAKSHSENSSDLSKFFGKLYRFRLKVKKDNVIIVNLSLLFGILALIVSPHLVLIGLILALILGYRISFDKKDPAFAGANLERMVRNAGENVRESVSDFTRSFQDEPTTEKPHAAKAPEEQPTPRAERSYYASNPASATYHAPNPAADVPTIQVPVQVESQDGNVRMESDKDGYNSATVE